ncbi:MAG TPA: hypothetical protein VIH61_00715 [Waddliaceae bacterium]
MPLTTKSLMNNQEMASRKEVFKKLKENGYPPAVDKQWCRLNQALALGHNIAACGAIAGVCCVVAMLIISTYCCYVSVQNAFITLACIVGIPAIVGIGIAVVAALKQKKYLKEKMTAGQVDELRVQTAKKFRKEIQAYINALESRWRRELKHLSQDSCLNCWNSGKCCCGRVYPSV